MTEEEWLTCDDPKAMGLHIEKNLFDRRILLFALACCRRVMAFTDDSDVRECLIAAECVVESQEKKRLIELVYQATCAAPRQPIGSLDADTSVGVRAMLMFATSQKPFIGRSVLTGLAEL